MVFQKPHQAILVGERKRPNQSVIHHGECSGCGANPHGSDRNDSKRETRTVGQSAYVVGLYALSLAPAAAAGFVLGTPFLPFSYLAPEDLCDPPSPARC